MKSENIDQLTIQKLINYLVVGHVTADLTKAGTKLGGTVTFSGLTAKALGFNVGIITSCSPDLDLSPIQSLWKIIKSSHHSTTFENISDGVNRTQYLYHIAERLNGDDIPSFQHIPEIIHLGPVANEVDINILGSFPNSLKCLTPQGWMRSKNYDNLVQRIKWANYIDALHQADIAVISVDDVQGDEELIASMSHEIPIFVVTENKKGARVYWNNDARFINAPEVTFVDDTGAGDIFAAAFFCRYFHTKDPWEAGRFAVLLASWSVKRKQLDGIPSADEINQAKTQLLGQ
mgnify:CR=1 FL=1